MLHLHKDVTILYLMYTPPVKLVQLFEKNTQCFGFFFNFKNSTCMWKNVNFVSENFFDQHCCGKRKKWSTFRLNVEVLDKEPRSMENKYFVKNILKESREVSKRCESCTRKKKKQISGAAAAGAAAAGSTEAWWVSEIKISLWTWIHVQRRPNKHTHDFLFFFLSALSLGDDVLKPLEQHILAAAIFWTRSLTGRVAGCWRHGHICVHGEGSLSANTALPDHTVDVRKLLQTHRQTDRLSLRLVHLHFKTRKPALTLDGLLLIL